MRKSCATNFAKVMPLLQSWQHNDGHLTAANDADDISNYVIKFVILLITLLNAIKELIIKMVANCR